MGKVFGYLLALVIGGVFFWFGFHLQQSHAHKIATWTATTGVVTANEQSEDSDSQTLYRAVATFALPNGQVAQAREETSASSPSFAVGQQVRVYYDPANPSTAIVDNPGRMVWFPLVFEGVGGLVLLLVCARPILVLGLVVAARLNRVGVG